MFLLNTKSLNSKPVALGKESEMLKRVNDGEMHEVKENTAPLQNIIAFQVLSSVCQFQ